jgi:hypothetical protein
VQIHGSNGLVDQRLTLRPRAIRLTGEVQAEADVLFQAQPRQQRWILKGHRHSRVWAVQHLAK